MKDDIAHALEGNPPEWFPSDKQIDFRSKRRDMSTKMTLDDLCHDIQGIIEMHGEHFADANYWKHEYTPTTINGIPDTVGDDLAITARYVCAAILGEKKGLPLLMGNEYAGRVVKGDDYGRHQAKIAGNPRGKVGDDDKTITEIIGELATMREHRDYTAKEIWNPFISALKERELEPEENETNSEWRKWTICYDYKEGRKTITGGRFANVVYEARKHKKTR